MEQKENCDRCKCQLSNRGSWTRYRDEVPVETICDDCKLADLVADYQKTGIITTRLMTVAALCQYHCEENPKSLLNLRDEVVAFYDRHKVELLVISRAVKDIAALAREFEVKHWLGSLKDYWGSSPARGHRGQTENLKVLMWGSAGRVLVQFEDAQPDGVFGGGRITLIFDDSANYPRGGIQGICASSDEVLALLRSALDHLPTLAEDDTVTVLGL